MNKKEMVLKFHKVRLFNLEETIQIEIAKTKDILKKFKKDTPEAIIKLENEIVRLGVMDEYVSSKVISDSKLEEELGKIQKRGRDAQSEVEFLESKKQEESLGHYLKFLEVKLEDEQTE